MPLYAVGLSGFFFDLVVFFIVAMIGEDFIAKKHRVYAMPIMCFFAIIALGCLFCVGWGLFHHAVHIVF